MKKLNSKILSILLCLSVSGISTVGFAKKNKEKDNEDSNQIIAPIVQIDESNSLSQLLRSNAANYWKFISDSTADEFRKWLNYKGMVMGDTHLGNFLITELKRDGKSVFEYKNGDRDDAGIGPYAFDFAHLVQSVVVEFLEEKKVYTKKILDKNFVEVLKKYESFITPLKKQMIENYLEGINGRQVEIPNSIKQWIQISESTMETERKKYVSKRIHDSVDDETKEAEKHLFFETGEIEKYTDTMQKDFKIKKEDIKLALQAQSFLNSNDFKIHHIAIRPKKRGGSVNGKRFWVLVEKLINNEFFIYEVKQKEDSKMISFSIQDPIDVNWTHSDLVFGFEKNDQPLIKIKNEFFILREKRVALYDTPDPKKEKQADFFKDLARYDAYMLGQWHRNQAGLDFKQQFEDYLNEVNANPKQLTDLIDWVISTYADMMFKKLIESNI